MTWSMPRPVLQIVAAVLALIAIGGFVSGVLTAAPRARLPGERPASTMQDQGASNVPDAVPLSDDRIEGAPEPEELSPEEVAKLEAEKKAKEEEAARRAAEDAAAASAARSALPPPPAPVPLAPPPIAPDEPPPLDEPLY